MRPISELLCCGCFTAKSKRLYYNWTDVPPFGVKGPAGTTGNFRREWQSRSEIQSAESRYARRLFHKR